jgi:hypothetical protein
VNKILPLIFAFMFSSCIQVVEMEVEATPTLLVINCFFTENEPFIVHVSRLAPYKDSSDRTIQDAKVTIYADGKFYGLLPFQISASPSIASIYTNAEIKPVSGVLYEVRVEVMGYPVATAKDSLPGDVKIDDVSYIADAGMYEDGLSYNQFSIRFHDRPGADYYLIDFDGLEIFSTDPAIVAEGITGSDFEKYFVFNDALFKNNVYTLKINMGDYYSNIMKYTVLLISGTYNYHQYLKRLIHHGSYSWQDPFKPFDPVPLYSNVQNGLGIFAGFQGDIYDLQINN